MTTDEQRKKWKAQAAAINSEQEIWRERFTTLALEMFGKTDKWTLTIGERDVLLEEYNKRYPSPGFTIDMSGTFAEITKLQALIAEIRVRIKGNQQEE